MNKLKFFATLCCATLLFAACDKDNEPLKQNDPANDTKEAVDLGLSVKWATCNVGATSPEKYGNYYAWGEIETKGTYSEDTYTYAQKPATLPSAADVATAKWGGAWRMPTNDEWKELRENCTWTWTTKNGVNGYVVKASNGNSIFLPAAGYCSGKDLTNDGSEGCYWSSSLNTDKPNYAWYMGFYSDLKYGSIDCDLYYYGRSVRPVCE